jgi:hypothetical protein
MVAVTQGMNKSERPKAVKRSEWVMKKLAKTLDGWKISNTALIHKTETCLNGFSGYFAQTVNLEFNLDEHVLVYEIHVEIRSFLTRLELYGPGGCMLESVQAKKKVVEFCGSIDKVLEKDFTRALFDKQLRDGIKLFNKQFKGTKAKLEDDDDHYEVCIHIKRTSPFYDEEDDDRIELDIRIRDGHYILTCNNLDDEVAPFEHKVNLGDPELTKAICATLSESIPEIRRLSNVECAMSNAYEMEGMAITVDEIYDYFKGAKFSIPQTPENLTSMQMIKDELDKMIAVASDFRSRL